MELIDTERVPQMCDEVRRRDILVQEVILQLHVTFDFALKYCFSGLS
jgi:hypothetical protein